MIRKSNLSKTMKSTPIPQVVLAVLCMGTILGSCTAFSTQSHPQIAKSQHDLPTLFNSRFPTAPSDDARSIHNASTFIEGLIPIDLTKLLHSRVGNHDTEIRAEKTYSRHSLLHSLAVVTACRRLSFLILSVSLVNFFRSTILKIPISGKRVFDECPWPFTLFHDPIKFVKDAWTHMVVVWVVMCQIYSRIEKARAVIPIP